jgi:hypothetical protein
MDSYCEQAGCSEKLRKRHAWKWDQHRWHSHPIPTFCAWWEPSGVDPENGASVGGHPDAWRIWARKDPGRWIRRRYGIETVIAWNAASYVKEFDAWQNAGSPEPDEPFISLAASLERQKQFWADLKPIIDQIGKPMPKAHSDENANPFA